MIRTAEISACGKYRYALGRRWADGPAAVFVMLNPSTADAVDEDPTIRKCIGFAKRWGMGGIEIGNLFAFRARDPKSLNIATDLIGPDNDEWLRKITSDPTSSIIVAWGANGDRFGTRVRSVVELIGRATRCLLKTSSGQPMHPLMMPYSVSTQPWEIEDVIVKNRRVK